MKDFILVFFLYNTIVLVVVLLQYILFLVLTLALVLNSPFLSRKKAINNDKLRSSCKLSNVKTTLSI